MVAIFSRVTLVGLNATSFMRRLMNTVGNLCVNLVMMVQTCMALALIFNIRNRLLALSFIVLVSVPAFSQTQNLKGNIKDSLYQDSIKSCPDTVRCKLNSPFYYLPTSGIHKSKRHSQNFNLPKIDPYRRKFADLQILRTIGSHISR